MEAVDKAGDFPQRKGRVCAGNPRRVSCAIEILSFQNFYKVLKTGSAGRKDFFDTLKKVSRGNYPRLTFSCPVPSGLPHRSHCVPMNMNRYGFEVFSFFKSNLKYHRFVGLLNIMLNEKVFASCAVLCRDF